MTARARKPPEPKRGDVVEVRWADITEDPCGDPDTAVMKRRKSVGIFWARRQDDGVAVLVTTTTKDDDGPFQSGWCIYPEACVVGLRVIKRGLA